MQKGKTFCAFLYLCLEKGMILKMEKEKKKGKLIRNILIFNLLILLTFYLILKDQDFNELYNAIISVKVQYILIAVFAMFVYITCEAINLKRILKVLGKNIGILKGIKYTLIGFFFSSITPAASGGQPMEIYCMYKEGIAVSQSTLALLMQLCAFQIVTISFALFSVTINYTLLNKTLILFFIIGIALNGSALTLLLIGIFSKRLSEGLIKVAIKILKFFRIKNIEEKQVKWEKEVQSYQASAIYIKKHKIVMLKTLLTTLVQLMTFYSVTYWVYCSFGFNKYNIFQVITIQSVLYAIVSGIPSPGAVGVTEGGFVEIYKSVFTNGTVSSAMILSRGVSFYLLVIISCLIVVVNSFKIKKNDKFVEVTENKMEDLNEKDNSDV